MWKLFEWEHTLEMQFPVLLGSWRNQVEQVWSHFLSHKIVRKLKSLFQVKAWDMLLYLEAIQIIRSIWSIPQSELYSHLFPTHILCDHLVSHGTLCISSKSWTNSALTQQPCNATGISERGGSVQISCWEYNNHIFFPRRGTSSNGRELS